jgi:galactokinase
MLTHADGRSSSLRGLLAELDPRAGHAEADVRIVRAPGRVNLIGEHTDYNLGYVMPAAISLETRIASVPRDDRTVRIASRQEQGVYAFDVDHPGPPVGTWVDYVAGVANALDELGVELRGVSAVVDSAIPSGAGLSSSAALELAAAWTLCAARPPPLDALSLARAAQRAENEYVGVQCGIMDQFASANGRAGNALLLDCRSLQSTAAPLPNVLQLVALDTRTPHRLGASEYNARRAQCERGVAVLGARYPGVESLRDVTASMLDAAADALDDETLRRCRHVIEENERVLAVRDALAAEDFAALGRLFAESHASLRTLYEVSSPELDALVDIATSVPGVVASRMTGAGFGGCTVNFVSTASVDRLRDAIMREYPRRTGLQPGFYVVDAVDGAGLVA